VVPAVITFAFDPILRLGDLVVPWETLGTAGAILLALLGGAALARRTPPDGNGRRLHLDDLLIVVVGAVPGAIIGGRIGYALIHADYYGGHLGALLDPSQGGFELSLAVAGGVLSGAYLAAVLDAPVGRWAHVAAIPLLLAIGGGKAAMAWGASGQGTLIGAPLATRYVGPGPWGSLAADLPAHPSQLYEAGAVLVLAAVLTLALVGGAFRRRDGRLLPAAIALWLAARVAVGSTWRDPAVLGPLCADQVLSLALLALSVLSIALLAVRPRRSMRAAATPDWPDPAVASSWRRSAGD
jgi:prolipoprotein diacylglyceryltransferase